MNRPATIPAEKKLRIVLSVLHGEISIAEAAAVEIRVWKKSAESRLGPSRTSR